MTTLTPFLSAAAPRYASKTFSSVVEARHTGTTIHDKPCPFSLSLHATTPKNKTQERSRLLLTRDAHAHNAGVTDLHCLHVWSLTLGRTVVSAHMKATDPEKALAEAHGICEAMGVAHSTFQVILFYFLVWSASFFLSS